MQEGSDELYYEDEGELIACPAVNDGIEDAVIFLSDRIPEFPFVISEDQTDIQNAEIEAIYSCAMISAILGGKFKQDFKSVVDNYNYDEIESEDKDFELF